MGGYATVGYWLYMICLKLEFRKGVAVMVTDFCVVTPRTFMDMYQSFGGPSCFHPSPSERQETYITASLSYAITHSIIRWNLILQFAWNDRENHSAVNCDFKLFFPVVSQSTYTLLTPSLTQMSTMNGYRLTWYTTIEVSTLLPFCMPGFLLTCVHKQVLVV
jgi:hypothetical protein